MEGGIAHTTPAPAPVSAGQEGDVAARLDVLSQCNKLLFSQGIQGSQSSQGEQSEELHQMDGLSSRSEGSIRVPVPGLNLISMEEFDQEMRREREEEGRKVKENEHSRQGGRSRKLKLSPSSPPSEPVLLSTKPKAEWTVKLMHTSQIHRLTAKFDFTEETPQSFSATLLLTDGDQQVQSFSTGSNLYRSKKEAKENVAEQAVRYLDTREPRPKHKVTTTDVAASGGDVDKSENWMGLINHFCQTSALPTPVFKDYQRGNDALFSTTCTMTLRDRGGITFGDATRFYSSKKAAKVVAAKEAVVFLRQQGALPSAPIAAGIHTSLNISQNMSSASMTASDLVDSLDPSYTLPASQNGDSTDSDSNGVSVTVQIINLCRILNLPQPQYKYLPSDNDTPNFLDGAAYFPGEPDLRGPIGRVERVFGKKKAKEECAKRVLLVLEELKTKRLAAW